MTPPNATVLVIDDDASVRRALQRLLRAAGYSVQAFPSAAVYLEEPASAPPACLVLDVRMPGMTGIELQQKLRGTARDLPIVFVTGHGDDEIRSQALGGGAVEFLNKPLDEAVLLAAIERALERSRPQ
jgi:FixJ family two-component response regulator